MHKKWTAEEVETWLADAALALRSMPDREKAWLSDRRNWWPETVPDAEERFALLVEAESNADTAKAIKAERHHVRTLPSPEQVDRLNTVMDWFRLLPDRPAVFILWGRAQGYGWSRIGAHLGEKRQNVRYRHSRLLEIVARKLNQRGYARPSVT